MTRKRKLLIVISAVTFVVVCVTALLIMLRGAGLQDGLDFGAGAYYYADIPDFEKYLHWDTLREVHPDEAGLSGDTGLPYWLYAVLFLLWGLLMYLLWVYVDRRR